LQNFPPFMMPQAPVATTWQGVENVSCFDSEKCHAGRSGAPLLSSF